MSNAVDKRLLLTSQKFLNQKTYWEETLSRSLDGEAVFPETGNRTEKRTDRETISLSDRACSRLMTLSNRSGLTVYIVLLAAIKALLYRYSRNAGTTAAVSPVYESNVTDQTINDFVVITGALDAGITFKELLMQVTQSVRAAYENQDYPMADMLAAAARDWRPGVACLLDPIHSAERIQSLEVPLTFSFNMAEDRVGGVILYDPRSHTQTQAERLSRHFSGLTEFLVHHVDTPVATAPVMPEDERRRLLVDLNDTQSGFPRRTIPQLFEEQVAKTPDAVALTDPMDAASGRRRELTYRQLDHTAGILAAVLVEKGARPDSIVALTAHRSVEMIAGIMGILKAGAAYLPIEPGNPEERTRYMLSDSGAEILVCGEKGLSRLSEGSEVKDIIYLDELFEASESSSTQHSTLNTHHLSSSLAYVIYTSGTTGRPKGTLTTHENAVRVVRNTNYIDIVPEDRVLQLSNYAFDGSVFDIYGALLNGAALVLAKAEEIPALDRLAGLIRGESISVFFVTTALFNALVDERIDCFDKVRKVLFGGERVSVPHVRKALEYMGPDRIIHVYGPTETTVYATYYPIDGIAEGWGTIPIGRPIADTTAYILDRNMQPAPSGAPGELYIGGAGVSRGYLNNPELTAERFIDFNKANMSYKSYSSHSSVEKLYRTGDLVRWLLPAEGPPEIEFLDRIDHQVKIRGFRIEMGEIEHRLLSHESVKETVVTCRDDDGGKYLCAYIVGAAGPPDITLLREHLSRSLPDFMVPAHFVGLDELPLNVNGKVDIKALPVPSPAGGEGEFTAPRGRTEETLTAIWSDVLDIPIESISIDANFFELGGHSLKINILITRIHKAFNVKIELADVFMIQTIRELAAFIETAETNVYVSIEPAPQKDHYELSSAQKRLYFLYRRDLEDTSYNMPMVLEMKEGVDTEKLENAFRRLIERHESLRTAFVTIDEEPVQRIYDQVDFNIEHFDLTASSPGDHAGTADAVNILRDFVRPFDLSSAPLLRVGLIRESETKHTMVVDIHHVISDGASHEILTGEFAALYMGRELPPLKLQYKDYSEWQNTLARSDEMLKQKEFWRKQFEDTVPILEMPIDFPRPAVRESVGVRILTEIPEPLVWKLKKMALARDTTLYSVLLAAFTLLLSKVSGQDDIVVGSPVSGRTHADLHPIIGLFANMLPMRNRPREDKTFTGFLEEVKENTLRAFENQDLQFDQLLNSLKIKRDPARHPLFDAVLALQNVGSEDVEHKNREILGNLNVVPFPYEQLDVQHDFLVMAEEKGGKLDILLEYAGALFKRETIDTTWNYFIEILEQITENDNLLLKDIRLSHDAVSISAMKEEEGDFNF